MVEQVQAAEVAQVESVALLESVALCEVQQEGSKRVDQVGARWVRRCDWHW